MPAKLKTLTLGCKVNQYETQYVKELLERAGHVEARGGEPAELCVVNTCTVTHEGDAKSRQSENAQLVTILGWLVPVVGLIVHLATRPNVKLVVCPNCKKQRIEGSTVCPHCGRP